MIENHYSKKILWSLLSYVFIAAILFVDVVMRVGKDYQAKIPDISDGKNLIHKSQ